MQLTFQEESGRTFRLQTDDWKSGVAFGMHLHPEKDSELFGPTYSVLGENITLVGIVCYVKKREI